jgi:hypothetical protein
VNRGERHERGEGDITASDGTLTAATVLTLYGLGARIAVSVSPTSIPANGTSAATVRVVVRDATGDGVPGETAALSSSLAGDTIATVVDHGTGVYTATLPSGTRPGQASITATDGNLTASTTLTQA